MLVLILVQIELISEFCPPGPVVLHWWVLLRHKTAITKTWSCHIPTRKIRIMNIVCIRWCHRWHWRRTRRRISDWHWRRYRRWRTTRFVHNRLVHHLLTWYWSSIWCVDYWLVMKVMTAIRRVMTRNGYRPV